MLITPNPVFFRFPIGIWFCLSLLSRSSSTRRLGSRCRARGRSLTTLSSGLAALQVCKSASLGVNILHLLVGLGVKVPQLPARGSVEGLLEVVVQITPASGRLVAELVVLVQTTSTVRGVVLLVEGGQSAGEARREPVLVVQSDGLLDGSVAEGVAVGQVLSYNARTGLVLLLEVVVVLVLGLSGAGGLVAGDVVKGLGRLDVHEGGTKLGVVEEESGLSSTIAGDIWLVLILWEKEAVMVSFGDNDG